MTDPTLPAGDTGLAAAARAVLDGNWRPEGYTVPNAEVYPFQWLWDSCFHSIAWATLGEPDRAVRELRHLFRTQTADGFVPHIDYEFAPDHHAEFWGRTERSTITQPPMFGHAIAELHRRGVLVDDLIAPATAGLRFLLEVRSRVDGLIALCHPWESGADDCPRWDHWCPPAWSVERWRARKSALVGSVVMSDCGSPIANPDFRVGSCGFNALVAFNALELASVSADRALHDQALALVVDLDARWDDQLRTWVDTGDSEATSGRVRSLDALLPMLVSARSDARAAAFAELADPAAFAARFGPTGLHRREPTFAARTYWRGPAWPQLSYLCWVAARRHGASTLAESIARSLIGGARSSGWSEYWDPDDGSGLGAAPQSWTAIAVTVAEAVGDLR